MAKKNRISINAFDEAAQVTERVSEVEWNGLDIEVKERIGYTDMVLLITSVTDASFGENGDYCPEATDFAFRLAVFAMYTNLAIPANIEKRYDMAYGTSVFDAVLNAIDQTQIASIRHAIGRRVAQRVRAGADAVLKQAGEVSEAILQLKEKLDESFKDLLGDIDPKEMNAILHGLAENGLDEEKVVKAYMDQKATPPRSDEEAGMEIARTSFDYDEE